MVNNDIMTVWEELLVLAEATEDAADRAGAVSRARSTDVQLMTVKQNASALKQRVLELAESEGA